MKKKTDLIKAWFMKADHDLKAAESLLESGQSLNDIISFHCQQAVEKYLKGYMIYLDMKFIKTHEIGELITMIEKKDPDMTDLKERADKLTDYSVEVRYPEDFYLPTPEEIREAIDIAREVKTFVINRLSPNRNPNKRQP